MSGPHKIGAPYDADVRCGDTFTDGDETMVACPPATHMYEGPTGKWGTGWWQVGTCDGCGTRCISQAKWMVCLKCGATVYGT